MATEEDSGPRLTFQNSFGLFWGPDFNQGFQTPEGDEIQERLHGCMAGRDLSDSSFCP